MIHRKDHFSPSLRRAASGICKVTAALAGADLVRTYPSSESNLSWEPKHAFRPPRVSQKLSEWTWNHDSKLNKRCGEAMLFIQSERSTPAVQDDGMPAVNPLSEYQGDGSKEFSDDEPCVHPSRWTFDSEARLRQSSYTRQSSHTATDHFTDVLVSPKQTECTTARTAPPPTLSALQESQRRTSVKGPKKLSHLGYSTHARPRTRDDLVAASAIGLSTHMATILSQGSSSCTRSVASHDVTGGYPAAHTMQRRNTDPTSCASSLNRFAGLILSHNSSSSYQISSAGEKCSSATSKPGANGAPTLNDTGSKEIGSACQACAADLLNQSRNVSIDWIG